MNFRRWLLENDLGITDVEDDIQKRLASAEVRRAVNDENNKRLNPEAISGLIASGYKGGPLDDKEKMRIADAVRKDHEEWATETRKVHGVLMTVIDGLQRAIPNAVIRPAGSMSRGEFFTKGSRAYDLDVYVILPDAASQEGKYVIVDPETAKAFKKAETYVKKTLNTVLDIFVKSHGKLWFYKSGKLSQAANNFGKQRFATSNGLTVTGRPMKWGEFQDSFFKDHPE